MRCFAAVFVAISVAITTLPTTAQTIIPRLGVAPVAGGPLSSTHALRAHAAQLLAASKTLGLSSDEADALRDGLTTGVGIGYGPIPRHLDAMTSAGSHGYYAIHNVIIPAGQNGWIIVVSNRATRTTFYIPNACGNVSIVRAVVPPATAPPAAPAPVVTSTPESLPATPAPASTPFTAAAPSYAPNKTFWQRYGTILGAIVVPLVVCAAAGCFRGGGGTRPTHPTHPLPPPTRPTPLPPTPQPIPTMRGIPPVPPTTPRPSPTASCPPLTFRITPPRH